MLKNILSTNKFNEKAVMKFRLFWMIMMNELELVWRQKPVLFCNRMNTNGKERQKSVEFTNGVAKRKEVLQNKK